MAVALIAQSSSDGRRTPVRRAAQSCLGRARQLADARPARDVPRAAPAVRIGLSVNLRSTRGVDRCRDTRLMRAIGVRTVREDLDWGMIEPARGDLRWGAYDALLRTSAEQGITLLPLIDDTPSWAGPASGALPSDPADYVEFVAQVVARYGPGGSYWRVHPTLAARAPDVMELYNEPYYDHVHPAAFAQLVRRTAIAAQAANPRVRLLAPAIAGRWLDRMYAAVPDLFESYATAGAAVHPYTLVPPTTGTTDTSSRTALVHATMAAHGDGDVGVWITEIGWSTCPVRASECVSERTQASDLAGTLRLARTAWRPWLKAVFVYDLFEFAPRRRADRESWFGLVRPDWSPKPAWAVLLAAAEG